MGGIHELESIGLDWIGLGLGFGDLDGGGCGGCNVN